MLLFPRHMNLEVYPNFMNISVSGTCTFFYINTGWSFQEFYSGKTSRLKISKIHVETLIINTSVPYNIIFLVMKYCDTGHVATSVCISHGVNSIWSILIPHQIYQFNSNSSIPIPFFLILFSPNTFYHGVGTPSTYLEYLLRVVYIPSRIVMEEIFLY